MKKRWKWILPPLALLLAFAGLFAWNYFKKPFHKGDLTGAAAADAAVGRAVPSMDVNGDGDFTILQINDTHLITSRGKDEKTIDAIAAQLDRLKPDLVVAAGDILDGFNSKIFVNKRAALCALADMFELRGQYWAYVPGNNDGEYLGSTADVTAFLAENYAYCILSNPPGLSGETQYAIPLREADGNVVHELIFMDSLMRDPETHYLTYDSFKQDQADWLLAQLTELKEQAPNARASVFFHMNTPAFSEAKNRGEAYAEGYAMIDFPDNWAIQGNYIVDDAMRAAGNVGLVSIGHLHPPVNWCAYLGTTYYHITRPAGYQVTKRPGGAKITIHTADGNPRRLYEFEEIVF
ncbi:MAG: metallophosphoesterase [Oscillospiraceae bacterium]|jgi:hypothetical protein|nr:metallophosphoesterase [Oscillospiraceae bacterium]